MGFWPCTAAAVRPAAALKTPVRIPRGEYEEEMQLPSAGGSGGGGHCCKCAVPGALFLLRAMISGLDIKNYEDETHHPSTGGTDGGGGC